MTPRAAPILLLAGAILILLGLLAWAGGLAWFGRLPGDVRLERDSLRVFVPITSMLVLSAALTLVVNLLRRLL